ncbi:MAG: hypothetical protein WEB04_10340 [Dehalococcoidia bacterium]
MSHSFGLRRTWFWLLGAGPLMLLLSMLPQYLAIDHWEEYYRHMIRHEIEEPEEGPEHTSHEQHCHYGSAACSDQPAPINGRVLPAAVELSEPSLPDVAYAELSLSRLEDVFLAPASEPPRLQMKRHARNHVTV